MNNKQIPCVLLLMALLLLMPKESLCNNTDTFDGIQNRLLIQYDFTKPSDVDRFVDDASKYQKKHGHLPGYGPKDKSGVSPIFGLLITLILLIFCLYSLNNLKKKRRLFNDNVILINILMEHELVTKKAMIEDIVPKQYLVNGKYKLARLRLVLTNYGVIIFFKNLIISLIIMSDTCLMKLKIFGIQEPFSIII